jgi:hypothetical protein
VRARVFVVTGGHRTFASNVRFASDLFQSQPHPVSPSVSLEAIGYRDKRQPILSRMHEAKPLWDHFLRRRVAGGVGLWRILGTLALGQQPLFYKQSLQDESGVGEPLIMEVRDVVIELIG